MCILSPLSLSLIQCLRVKMEKVSLTSSIFKYLMCPRVSTNVLYMFFHLTLCLLIKVDQMMRKQFMVNVILFVSFLYFFSFVFLVICLFYFLTKKSILIRKR